jgi:hypothetical protein
MSTDSRIDAYIDRQAEFAKPILAWLRERIHAACPEVEETIKWSMPSFLWKGRPLAHMAAFKAHAAFGFWYRHELGTGKEGEAMGQYGRIESLADLPSAEELEEQARSAMAFIESGTKAQRTVRAPKPEAEIPPELAEALAGDEAASELPPRILRMDRRGQAPRDSRQARRRSGRLAARGQEAQLEIRELLNC